MVQLMEQERLLDQESFLLNDPTTPAFPTSMGTIKSYTTLGASSSKLVAWSCDVVNSDSVSRTFQLRLKAGGNIFFATGAAITLTAGQSVTYGGLLYLDGGSYEILAEGVASTASLIDLTNFKIGLCKFNDQTMAMGVPYSAAVVAAAASARVTPLGQLIYTMVYVAVGASTPGEVTNLENNGETLTNGV